MATTLKYYSIDVITKYFATMQQKESVSEKSSPLRTSKYFLYLVCIMNYYALFFQVLYTIHQTMPI
jgi:hypothetical protein